MQCSNVSLSTEVNHRSCRRTNRGFVQHSGNAEIGDVGIVLLVEQNVGRGDVTVDDLVLRNAVSADARTSCTCTLANKPRAGRPGPRESGWLLAVAGRR